MLWGDEMQIFFSFFNSIFRNFFSFQQDVIDFGKFKLLSCLWGVDLWMGPSWCILLPWFYFVASVIHFNVDVVSWICVSWHQKSTSGKSPIQGLTPYKSLKRNAFRSENKNTASGNTSRKQCISGHRNIYPLTMLTWMIMLMKRPGEETSWSQNDLGYNFSVSAAEVLTLLF